MNIINNRYRIVDTIDDKQILTSLEVIDLLRNDSKLRLSIIDLKNFSDSAKDYIKNEFINLVNLNEKSIYRLYSLNVINSIDNKFTDDMKWYYTCEINREADRLSDIVESLDENSILDIFLQVCVAIQYLNCSGYVYKNIDIKNIYVDYKDGKFNIKLNDLISAELDRINKKYKSRIEAINFKLNLDNYNDYQKDIIEQIHKLGILLFELCKSKFVKNIEIDDLSLLCDDKTNTDDIMCSENPHKKFLLKIAPIIDKMVSNIDRSYTNIKDIVNHINDAFEKYVDTYEVRALEKLNYNVKIVGRDKEIKKVLNLCNFSKSGISKSNLFIVHGKSGIGKTRFLKEIKYIFKFNMDNVYYSFGSRDYIKRNVFDEIFKQILVSYDYRVIKTYERELGNEIFEMLKDIKKDSVDTKQKDELFDRCISFMNIMAERKKLVIILDNLDKIDDFSIDFIRYFYRRIRNTKNIVIMFSYSDESIYVNNNISQFINSFKISFTDITLNELNFNGTNELIGSVLGTITPPKEFAKKIFEKTKGNPGFIIEVLKGLYVRKYIYVNEEDGLWVTSYDKINEIPIHSSLVKNIQNQINDMDGIELEVVNAMSIFNVRLNIGIIKMFFKEYDDGIIEATVAKLIKRGAVEYIEEDSGIYYNISNKVIKTTLTEKMNAYYKSSINERAAEVLEKIDPDKYREEILYHFENSLNVNKIIEYYLGKYKHIIYVDNREKVISKIKRLVRTIRTDCSLSGIRLLIILGDLLLIDEKIEEAQIYFNLAVTLAESIEEYDVQFQALKRIVRILQTNSKLKESRKYIRNQEKLLKKYYKLEFELLIYTEEAFNFYINKEFERAISICNNVLEKCNKGMEDVQFYAYYILSNTFIEKRDMQKALRYNKICTNKKYFMENLTYVLDSLNNIAYIYGNYYEDFSQCKNYLLEIFQIATNFNYSHFKLLSLSQIATLDFKQGNYKESYTAFKNVLDLSEKTNDKYIEVYCYCRLCKVCLVMYDIKSAYEYFIKASIRIVDFENDLDIMNMYYIAAIETYLKIGLPKKSKEYMEKFKEKYGPDNIKKKEEVVECFIDYLIEKNEESVSNFQKAVHEMNINNKSVNSITTIIQLAVIVYWKKDLEIFYIIYKKLSSYHIKNDVMKGAMKVIKALNASGEKMLKYSINAIRENEKDIKVFKFLYANIAQYYIKNGNYIRAINYFFDYIDFIWRYFLSVPDKYKKDFAMCYSIRDDLTKYIGIVNEYAGQEIILSKSVDVILNGDGIDKFYEGTNLKRLFYTRKFKKDLKKYYQSFIPREVSSRIDVMKNQVDSSITNIQNILRYLKHSLVAKKIYFILNQAQDEDTVVFTQNRNFIDNNILKENWVINDVNTRKKLIFIKRFGFKPEKKLEDDIKAVICMPVYKLLSNFNKQDNKILSGILYIETDKILNNFNVDAINKCIELNGLLSLNVDKYTLKISSTIDSLTGVMTRRYLDVYIDEMLQKERNSNKEFTVFMYDLDNFKAINDKFGHGTGDTVLKEVSRIVRNNIDGESICARYGGEEFIVILPNYNVLKAYEIADGIREKIDRAKILGNKRSVTISVGLVSYPDMARSREEIFEKVDKALYIAKNTGRNKCVIWNERFNYKAKVTNKITGIVTGNPVKDSRNVLVTVEFMELLRSSSNVEEKIYNVLGRLVEFFEAAYCSIILLDDKQISHIYTRKIFKTEFVKKTYINDKIVQEVLEKKVGLYMIDWDNISGFDETTGMPDWDSIMVIPLNNKGIIKGILYFKVPTKIKEFKFEEFNFASAISNIVAALI
ncbi:diguanylate cyclase [Clostridium acetobutylicum]|nr:diguanylate cyclase [Clostridium acetobutylicum]